MSGEQVAVRFDPSFPEPPSVETTADRLERSVERVEHGADLLFTDDPSTVQPARVVVTTVPAVVAVVRDATPVPWSHADPPWQFLAAALAGLDDSLVGAQADAAPKQDDAGHAVGQDETPDVSADRSTRTPSSTVPTDGSPTDGSPTDASPTDRDRPPERGSDRLIDALTEPAAALRIDPDGRARIEAVNRAFAAFADAPVVADPPGAVGDRLPEAVVDRLRVAVGRARATERGPSRTTVRVDRPDGTRHYVVHDAPYEDGPVTRSLVVFAEVTSLKRRETQTAVLTRILRHNLRNEVTVARGYAERIARTSDDPEITRAAKQVTAATTTLSSLGETAGSVQSVLSQDEPRWTTHDLPTLLDRVAARVENRYADATVTCEGISPTTVVGTHQLERALVELAENAVVHADSSAPTARLSADRADDTVRITVRDEGPGIPDAEWAVVAQRQEITQLRHASGLGLWLVRWIVENNGGRLERHEEDGTTVVVHLPRDR